MNQHGDERIEDGSKLLRQSMAGSDRKFWVGRRRLSLLQWIGVILLLVGSAVVATSLGFGAFAMVMGALIAFVLLGHFVANRKGHPRQIKQ